MRADGNRQPPDAGSRTEPLYRIGGSPREPRLPVRVVILGATGSIGVQAVDLAVQQPDRLQVVGLAAWSRVDELAALVRRLEAAGAASAPAVAFADPRAVSAAARDPLLGRRLLPPGPEGLDAIAALEGADCVVNGIVGAAGLAPTLAAAAAGRRIALANKESLVVGGGLVREAVLRGGAEIVPVDSEHSALAQCLSGRTAEELERLVLTASGGPFRTWKAAAMAAARKDEVLRHPTWNMGPKITVDSATLMNKGLEVIEAHVLFGVAYRDIEVVVHPGSIVHSLAVFRDGAVVAQLGAPDMRVPLLYALAGERHWPLATERLDLARLGELRFEAPDPERFPCLALARRAGEAGGRAPIILNAANETAVAALLDDRLGFADIAAVIAATLDDLPGGPVGSLAEALETDAAARRAAQRLIAVRARR
ncbi:MAG: 1-deoxy-D-xylulose-5-phosphate reductoisomerase [Candidatus Latescibacteria bacterium]|nr:1-deoxy-D-xylulose-5-phosphate reductoisomerase [Candidatus Latescibacterota bacterium]